MDTLEGKSLVHCREVVSLSLSLSDTLGGGKSLFTVERLSLSQELLLGCLNPANKILTSNSIFPILQRLSTLVSTVIIHIIIILYIIMTTVYIYIYTISIVECVP